MAAIAYLNFNGIAEQVIDFYSKALHAIEVKKAKYGDIPQNPSYPMPENELNMIMESSITFTGGKIMLSDVLPSMKAVTGELMTGNNILISLVIDDKQKLGEYFNGLSQGGTVIMPLSDTPWSSCFGMLVDKFGVNWKFNSDADLFLDKITASTQ
ncbi:3-demethylubiquinone-9 3-methyltransferase [Paenibacillus sp. FSL R7-0273]|uniref:VOC family protein n=1 Tax=Paenibacillus sp. FSL R7-0273 TaxID=1536772 RepID=UPI0004F90852|nr:VOC family protein [Paenibacillus sp. FSL R7-0273]AIQ45381.1 3-demethylubiquinone-9 3-methyltransferase [Paenibacillus sp. FSL R7-0273]OMF89990.1 hypothetical protein BK144_18560 [Paenibacillus sp. FSL R7-0273]